MNPKTTKPSIRRALFPALALLAAMSAPAQAVIEDAECGKQSLGTDWADAGATDYPNLLENSLLFGAPTSSIGAGPDWICNNLAKQSGESGLIWTTKLETSGVGGSAATSNSCGGTNVYTNAFGGWGLMASVGAVVNSASSTHILCSWTVPYSWLSNGVDYKFETRHMRLGYNWEGQGDSASTSYTFTSTLTLEADDIFTDSYSQFVCFQRLPGTACV